MKNEKVLYYIDTIERLTSNHHFYLSLYPLFLLSLTVVVVDVVNVVVVVVDVVVDLVPQKWLFKCRCPSVRHLSQIFLPPTSLVSATSFWRRRRRVDNFDLVYVVHLNYEQRRGLLVLGLEICSSIFFPFKNSILPPFNSSGNLISILSNSITMLSI